MIYSVKTVQKFTNGRMHYIHTNEDCKDILKKLEDGISFKEGVNILVGKNGSGKSTVINLLRYLTFCDEYYVSTLKCSDMNTRFDIAFNGDLYESISLKADFNKPVFNLYSMQHNNRRGNESVMASFESAQQFLSMTSASNGQNQMLDFQRLMKKMFGQKLVSINELINNFDKDCSNHAFDDELAIARKFYADGQMNDKSDIYTILMDEPDQGLDVYNLKQIYDVLSANRKDTQIIVALHNVALINKLSDLPFVNIIEMSDGYLNDINYFF